MRQFYGWNPTEWWLCPPLPTYIENQQEVVQNEKRQRVDNRPYGPCNYVTIKNMYPEGHPYNWTVIGELEDLQNATLETSEVFMSNGMVRIVTMVITGISV